MIKKGFLKRTAAFATAGTLLISGASTAWAGAYADIEKADLEACLESLPAEWDESLEQTGAGKTTRVNADFSLHIGGMGSSMLQMFTGLDITWLDRLGFNMDVEVADGTENTVMRLYANDQTLASMLLSMDMAEGVEKFMIPELSSDAITLSFGDVDEDSLKSMQISMDIMKDPKAALPDGNTVKELITRYGGIILDHMQDGESAETALAVGDIEESCTVYEAMIDGAGMQELTTDLLNTAKEDEQLAEVVKNLEACSDEMAGLYDNMISAIDDELAKETEAFERSLTSKAYVNADGKVIGREFALDSDVSMQILNPSADDKEGFELSVSADGETYGISGIGTNKYGIVNGTYQLMANGVAMASAEVADLDANEGKSGTITLALAENMPDEETYGMLGAGQIVLTFDEEDGLSKIALELLYNGESLGDILLTGKETDTAVDVSALDSANTYNATSDEDMKAYTSNMDLNPILENITAAGAPEGFVENLMNLFMGSGDESYNDEYDSDDAEYEGSENVENVEDAEYAENVKNVEDAEHADTTEAEAESGAVA